MMFKVSAIIALFLAYNITYGEFIGVLDNDRVALCNLAYSTGEGSGSTASLYIVDLVAENETHLEDIKIPYAFFRYSDIAFYDNFPTYRSYLKKYRVSLQSLYDQLVDPDSNEFIKHRNNLSFEGILEEPNIRTGHLEYSIEKNENLQIDIEIDKSAMYSLYIAPPFDKGIIKLDIPFSFKNSFGYLSVDKYIIYNSLKISFSVGVLITVFLYYILNNSITSASFISTWLVKYVLVPIILVQGISIIPYLIENHTGWNERTSIVFKYGNLLINWVESCLKLIVNCYFTLLFSMGVGLIYLGNGSAARKLPIQLKRNANYLLLSDLLILTVNSFSSVIFDSYYYLIIRNKILSWTIKKIIIRLIKIIGMIGGIRWVLWLSFSIYFYFITKKSIAKFPAFEEPGVSKKITRKFRNSLLVINLTRFSFILINVVNCVMKMYLYISGIDIESVETEKAEAIYGTLVYEKLSFSFFTWEETLFDEYIIISALFFIWLHLDRDLKLEKKTQNEQIKD